jgi:hypothetical protein
MKEKRLKYRTTSSIKGERLTFHTMCLAVEIRGEAVVPFLR